MKSIFTCVVAMLFLGLILPQDATAQSVWERTREAVERERANQERERERERPRTEREREVRGEVEAERRSQPRTQSAPQRRARTQDARVQNRRGGQAGGPAFCRSNAGHPVYGMEWCYKKGFDTGDRIVWRRGSIGDIIFGRRVQRDGTVRGTQLEGVLGRDATRRVAELGRQVGLDGPVAGTWLGASVLELAVGGVPVARLVDESGDGRVDYALIAD